MNFMNSAPGSSGSNPYSLRRPRTFIARLLIKIGNNAASLAEWIAPWLASTDDEGRR